jgi:hypothetical protein
LDTERGHTCHIPLRAVLTPESPNAFTVRFPTSDELQQQAQWQPQDKYGFELRCHLLLPTPAFKRLRFLVAPNVSQHGPQLDTWLQSSTSPSTRLQNQQCISGGEQKQLVASGSTARVSFRMVTTTRAAKTGQLAAENGSTVGTGLHAERPKKLMPRGLFTLRCSRYQQVERMAVTSRLGDANAAICGSRASYHN